jgi:signal transduction histidine kinase
MLTTRKYVTVPLDKLELGSRSRELSILLEMSNLLAWSQSLNDVVHNGLSQVLKHFEMDAGRFYLLEQDGQHLRMAASLGVNTTGLKRMSINEGFTGKAARTRQFIAQHVSELPDKARVEMLTRKGLQVVVCVPLIALDQLVGVLNLGARRVIQLDQQTIDLFIVIGNQIAVAANNARLQEELRAKAKLLSEQKEAIQFFAYTASHDLKSPAVGIHALTQRLQKQFGQVLGDKGRETCEQIQKAAGRIDTLAREINAFIAAKESALRLENVDMAEVVESVRADFAARLAERGVAWVCPTGQPGQPGQLGLPGLRGERLGLARLWQNLVDNALKYGGPGLSRLEVLCAEEETAWVFGLADDGVGLDPASAEKVFQAFQRGDTSRGTEGTGLGLAIVAEVAQRHGGRAWLEPRPGGGACFRFSVAKDLEAGS